MKSFFIHHHGHHERVSSVGGALFFEVAGCMAGPVLWVFRQLGKKVMPLLSNKMAGLISVRERKYSNLFSLVPFANNVCTTNKIWRSQPKSVRRWEQQVPRCQLIQRCRQTGGARKEAYEKPKRLSTLKTPTIQGHVLDCHGLYARC